ncbi:MAG: hypothetical protein ACFCU9_09225 [Cyanophyceae cyanobacterium]
MTSPPETRDPTLADILAAIDGIRQDVAATRQDIGQLEDRLESEIRRWDERFFSFAEATANRANTLIASATIAVIAGVLLLVLRDGV